MRRLLATSVLRMTHVDEGAVTGSAAVHRPHLPAGGLHAPEWLDDVHAEAVRTAFLHGLNVLGLWEEPVAAPMSKSPQRASIGLRTNLGQDGGVGAGGQRFARGVVLLRAAEVSRGAWAKEIEANMPFGRSGARREARLVQLCRRH